MKWTLSSWLLLSISLFVRPSEMDLNRKEFEGHLKELYATEGISLRKKTGFVERNKGFLYSALCISVEQNDLRLIRWLMKKNQKKLIPQTKAILFQGFGPKDALDLLEELNPGLAEQKPA